MQPRKPVFSTLKRIPGFTLSISLQQRIVPGKESIYSLQRLSHSSEVSEKYSIWIEPTVIRR
jgi:hypothetical protein